MVVSVHAIFSHNSKIGSKLIANGTSHLSPKNPKCSHTALLVNNRWVHESTGHTGVRIISYDKWSKLNSEVARVLLPTMEYQKLADEYRRIKDKKYDYFGVFYLALCIFLTFFRFKLPKKNKWESSNKYFCSEVVGKLTGHYYGMSAPIQILQKLTK